MDEKVVVIGAGIGGLSAAIRLAAAGLPVTVYEQNDAPGGKMGQVATGGFRWDTGPSVITMRHVLEELFRAAGRRLEDYLDLIPVDPLTRYFYPDGSVLDASRDLSTILGQIEKLEPRDVEGYLAYLAYAARIHRVTGPVFIYDRPPRPASFLRVPINEWAAADPLRTMDGAIRRFVRSPQLRQMLGRFATYVGGSPYEAPATLNVIAHVELSGGVWYPRGGIYTIAVALRQVAEEMGVEIFTDRPVERVRVKGGRVTGVELAGGAFEPATAIVVNVDVTTAYERLLPSTPAVRRRLAALRRAEPSCSGFVLLLGVRSSSADPPMVHHNIFFSDDYPREFRFIFHDGLPPDDPTVYVAITSKTDPDHAPPGHENWFVLVNAPAVDERFDWTRQGRDYRQTVLAALARHGIDLRERIIEERMITPLDLARYSGAWRGALYGASANNRWAAFRRPHNRSGDFQGLYFAGGTTHPGGGVPMVTLSGKVAADLVLAEMAARQA